VNSRPALFAVPQCPRFIAPCTGSLYSSAANLRVVYQSLGVPLYTLAASSSLAPGLGARSLCSSPWPVCSWCTSEPVYLCISVPVCQRTGVLVYQCTGVPVYQCTGVPVHRCTSVPVYRCIGVLVYQCTRKHSPHPPPWPGRSFSLQLTLQAKPAARVVSPGTHRLERDRRLR